MSCCNCGCNNTPCKNLSISDIAPLDYVQGVDANGCPKFQSVSAFLSDDQTAAQVPYTPGNVAGVATVQAAIDALGTCCTTNTAAIATNTSAITALQAIDHAPGSDNQIAVTVPYTPGNVAGVATVQAAIDALGTCCTTNAAAITALQALAHAPMSDDQTAATVPIVAALNGNLDALPTVEAALQYIDNWSKRVINPGATVPIADIPDAGIQFLLTTGQLQFAETNDIITTIGTDRVVRDYIRRYSARAAMSAHILAPTGSPFGGVFLNYDTPIFDNLGGSWTGGGYTVLVAGVYRVSARAYQINQAGGDNVWLPLAGSQTSFGTIELFLNGVRHDLLDYTLMGTLDAWSGVTASAGWGHLFEGTALVNCAVGDFIQIRFRHSTATDKGIYGTVAGQMLTSMDIDLVR